MPIPRRTTLDLSNFDGALSLDLDAGVAVIDLMQVRFIDAYALTGLACFIASATGDGLPVELVLPERYDVRSWLSRMHLGDVPDAFEVGVDGSLPRVADGEVVNQLYEATGELGLNVVDHASSPAGGFVSAQRHKAGTPEEWIIVAVGDAGVGIRASLQARYGVMTDDEAIRQAIQWYVSRVPDQGRGQGLSGVVDGSRTWAGLSASGAVRLR